MPALQRTCFDQTHACIAVLDGRRKRSDLKRRAHPLVFAERHTALEHERFGAATDSAEQRSHDDLVRRGCRQGFGTNLASAWSGDPERAGVFVGHPVILAELPRIARVGKAEGDSWD